MATCSLKEVAKACKVSVMTASRAFRESSAILPETREKILAAAEKMGYTYSQRKGRVALDENSGHQQVQLIFGNAADQMYYFHMRLLTSLEQQLAEAGLECLIRTCNGSYPIFVRLLDRVRNDQSRGTIILGSFVQKQLETLLDALPGAILIDNCALRTPSRNFTAITFNNRDAAFQAVTHLMERRRRKILLLCGHENHFFSQELIQGYREAYGKYHLTVDERCIRFSDFSASGAADTMRQVLEEGLEFDAVFTNDEMATGVYRVLYEKGVKIPDEIAVCGCDDLPIGAQLFPALTTISLNYHDLGACAIQYLLNMQTKAIYPEIRLPVTLRPRSST